MVRRMLCHVPLQLSLLSSAIPYVPDTPAGRHSHVCPLQMRPNPPAAARARHSAADCPLDGHTMANPPSCQMMRTGSLAAFMLAATSPPSSPPPWTPPNCLVGLARPRKSLLTMVSWDLRHGRTEQRAGACRKAVVLRSVHGQPALIHIDTPKGSSVE